MTHYELWAAVFIGAMITGASLVGLLALSRSREPMMFVVGLASVAATSAGAIRLVDVSGRSESGIIAGLVAIAAAGGGYGLASSVLPMMARHRSPVRLATDIPPNRQGTAVLLVAPVESDRYDPATVAAELEELTDAGLAEPTVGITPFLFAAQKARYRAAGGTSPSLKTALQLTERLETLLRADGRFGEVRLVTCLGRDTLEAAVAQLAAAGTKRIIAASLSVGESYLADRAKSQVDVMRPQSAGVRIVYTPALWGSERLCERLAERIWSARMEPHLTGVALIMHGQPESRERTHAAFDVQENAFCNRIRMLLADRGIPEANIRLCYLDWRNPDVTETVRHLAALGCRRVLVVPATLPFESVTTILDLKMAVRQARVQDHVNTVTLQAWGDEDAVAEALAERIMEAAADLM